VNTEQPKHQHEFWASWLSPVELASLAVLVWLPAIIAALAIQMALVLVIVLVFSFLGVVVLRKRVMICDETLEIKSPWLSRSVSYSEIEDERNVTGRLFSSVHFRLKGGENVQIFVPVCFQPRQHFESLLAALHAYQARAKATS